MRTIDFKLTGDMITFLQQKLALYSSSSEIDNNMPQLTTQGTLIRCLNIHDHRSKRNKLSGKEFSIVLSYMPNIKKIDLNRTQKHRYYLEKLQNTRTHAADLKHLEDISVSNKFTPIPHGRMKEYFKACYKYREILKYLYIAHIGLRYNMHGRAGDYIHFLPDFRNLTHLRIDNKTSRNLLLCSIFKVCPNLINLTYKSRFPIINDTTTEFSTLVSNDTIGGNSAYSNSVSITTTDPVLFRQQQNHFHSKYCSNLKEMHLSVPYIDVKCLMLYTPPQLDKLELRVNEISLDLWLQENDMHTIVHFAKQLYSVGTSMITMGKHSFYDNCEANMRRSSLLPRLLKENATFGKKINVYWKFIGALTQGRNLKVNLTLLPFGGVRMEPYFCYKFRTSNRNHRIDLQYVLDTNNCPKDDETGKMDLPSIFQIDDNESSASAGKLEIPTIHSVDINMRGDHYYYNRFDITDFNIHRMLEYTVFNCNNLNHLAINSLYSKYIQFKSEKHQASKRTLENLTECYLKNVHFSAELSSVFSNCFPNLTHCYMNGVFLTTGLSSITNHAFQNIKLLELNYCSGFSADEYCNYHWDFFGINHLNNLKLDMRNLNTNRARLLYIFFQIELTHSSGGEKDIKYYQLDKKSSSGERLVPTNFKDINNYNRVNSLKTTVFFHQV